MQKFNCHTHCYRCGHAVGKEEEYILAAIKAGFTTLGMSEHMGYPDWDDPKERIDYADLDSYLQTMQALKEKYKDQIQIRIGFECEYFSDMKEHLLNMKEKCDYLICGQHAYDRKGEHYYDKKEYSSDAYITFMAEQVCEGIETGLFSYIAHPDYFMYGGCEYTPVKEAAIYKIAQCAKEHDVVLEVNLKGMKYGKKEYAYGNSYKYPNTRTFEIIGEVGCKVCFGYDAHYPEALLEREKEEEMREVLKHCHLNYVEELQL